MVVIIIVLFTRDINKLDRLFCGWFYACLALHSFRRDRNNNEDQDEGKKRNVGGIEDIVDSINEEQKEIPEILLISNNAEHEQDRKPQNVELIKFLVNWGYVIRTPRGVFRVWLYSYVHMYLLCLFCRVTIWNERILTQLRNTM